MLFANAAATTNLFLMAASNAADITYSGWTDSFTELTDDNTGATSPDISLGTAWRLATANPGTVTVTDSTSSTWGTIGLEVNYIF